MSQIISEALVGQGVVKNSINKYHDGKTDVLMCEPNDYFTDVGLSLVVNKALTEVSIMDYDYFSCIGIPFKLGKRLGSKNRSKCSGHAVRAFEKIKFEFFKTHHKQQSPNHILVFMMCTHGQFFNCKPLDYNKKYRPGTIGIVINDHSLNFGEVIIEAFTGPGKHIFLVIE